MYFQSRVSTTSVYEFLFAEDCVLNLPPPPNNASAQPPPKVSRCQQTFRAPIRLVGHLRTNCSTRTASTVVSPSTSPSPPTPPTNVDRPPEPPLPSSSSSTASTSVAVASAIPVNSTQS
nr:unnamed protein product [Spirometra erinaceieuropaei]